MKIFLKAKHWHLFILYCSPYIVQVVQRAIEGPQANSNFIIVFLFFGLTTISLLGWIWSVAIELGPFDTIKESLAFKIAYSGVVIYIGICVLMVLRNFDEFRILLVPHIIAIVSIFYCMFFAARRLRLAEYEDKGSGDDYIGIFFLILFFPFGIWFLQPRVNKVYMQNIKKMER